MWDESFGRLESDEEALTGLWEFPCRILGYESKDVWSKGIVTQNETEHWLNDPREAGLRLQLCVLREHTYLLYNIKKEKFLYL